MDRRVGQSVKKELENTLYSKDLVCLRITKKKKMVPT